MNTRADNDARGALIKRLVAALEKARAALPDAWLAVKSGVPRELIEELDSVIKDAKESTGKSYPLGSGQPRLNPRARFVHTGEFRAPRKGDYYLSGAIPEAYLAPNDLSTSYYILREVRS
jgi:hypothetical protein